MDPVLLHLAVARANIPVAVTTETAPHQADKGTNGLQALLLNRWQGEEKVLKKITHVEILVSDIEGSIEWYRQVLGLRLIRHSHDQRWAEFDTEGTRLSLYEPRDDQAELKQAVGSHTGVVFGVRDMKAAYQDLAAKGAAFPIPPCKQPWGGEMAVFLDPDGNSLCLLSTPQQ